MVLIRKTMKKLLLLTAVLMAALTSAGAQERMTVRYFDPSSLDFFRRDVLEFEGITYMEILFGEDVKARKLSMIKVVCRDGVFDETDLGAGWDEAGMAISGVESFRILAKPLSDDQIRIMVRSNAFSMGAEVIDLPVNPHYTLMETYDGAQGEMTDGREPIVYPIDAEVPLVAYTTGIEKKMGDMKYIDFCGLRDAHVHPRLWFEKFGIKNYVYYTVRFK